jgi:tRNA A-37 threonylcarbamoyl transferase component Bud32
MTNYKAALKTSTPVAFGGFSSLHIIDGKAVKVLEDGCYSDTLQECLIQKQAADAGLAPQVYSIFEMANDVVVVMDAIDTDTFYQADAMDDVAPTLLGELDDADMIRGAKLYAKLLLAGIVHADFHTGNWFMNDNGEAIAIDFGIASTLGTASDTHLKRAVQFLLPCLQRMGEDLLADDLLTAYGVGAQAIRDSLEFVASEIV